MVQYRSYDAYCFIASTNMKRKALTFLIYADIHFDRPVIRLDATPRRICEISVGYQFFYLGALKNQVQHLWEKMLHGKTLRSVGY